MNRFSPFAMLASACAVQMILATPEAWGQWQERPYVGYVYPAGGQVGTSFEVQVVGGGSMHPASLLANVDEALSPVTSVRISGEGVQATVTDYFRPLHWGESLLSEQLAELYLSELSDAEAPFKRPLSNPGQPRLPPSKAVKLLNDAREAWRASGAKLPSSADPSTGDSRDFTATSTMIARIEKRLAGFERVRGVANPKCEAHRHLLLVRVTIAPDAEPGPRELRLVTPRGISNPVAFHVGQLREFTRKPMTIATKQSVGSEAKDLRKRPDEEAELTITVPCTVNGQIAYGEVNQYRFSARKGHHLVISTKARSLIPFIADAVPGWFQPVLAVYDAKGKELAYCDDYRFDPDPVIFFEVPRDGEYLLCIRDAIYRGREDFLYRITIGEVPFITSVFPLGGRIGQVPQFEMKGWNLEGAQLSSSLESAGPGVFSLVARRSGVRSNRVPIAINTLPECLEAEPNNDAKQAEDVPLSTIVNGRIDRPDDWDVFRFMGRAGEKIVAEVVARRLDSPLDSVVKITDAAGKLVAANDDCYDLGAGVSTHHADSYVTITLPADGTYYVWLGDAQSRGGEAYAYRLRLSPPSPDFALRVVPSGIGLGGNGHKAVSVYAIRKDGFTDPITVSLKNPPAGFSAHSIQLSASQPVAKLHLRTTLSETGRPVRLVIEGQAKVGDREIAHEAVPAEDRQQAFLWRHLVPAREFQAMVCDQSYKPSKRSGCIESNTVDTTNLTRYYQDYFFTEEFYKRKISVYLKGDAGN